jgi:hypothetical protein
VLLKLWNQVKTSFIKDRNIRYLVENCEGKEYNDPDIPSERKDNRGGMDNTRLWNSVQTIKGVFWITPPLILNDRICRQSPD